MIDLNTSLRVYLVADPEHCPDNLLETTRVAIAGGVTMVQLRAKNLSDRETLELAQLMRAVCHNVPFIVNDRVDIALAARADGVHLGVDDLPIQAARKLGRDKFIVGYSPDSEEDLATARERGASYLGIGPVFGTITKTDAGKALGIEEFGRRLRAGGLPTVGIGGVTSANAGEIMAAGAQGVAVVSAILSASDPHEAAVQISTNTKY